MYSCRTLSTMIKLSIMIKYKILYEKELQCCWSLFIWYFSLVIKKINEKTTQVVLNMCLLKPIHSALDPSATKLLAQGTQVF